MNPSRNRLRIRTLIFSRILFERLLALLAVFAIGFSGCASTGITEQRARPQSSRGLADLASGTIVKISLENGTSVHGQWVEFSDQIVFIETDGVALRLPVKELDSLSVQSISKREGRITGAAIGAIIGITSGYLLVHSEPLTFFEPSQKKHDPNTMDYVLGMTASGFAFGIIGAIIGNAVSSGTPTWEKVYP